MPATPSFEEIGKQVTALLDDANAKLMQAKNDERAVRLRISQLQSQLVHAQDALETAKRELESTESVSSARHAELSRSVDEAQKQLDTLLSEIEPAKRRYETVQAQIEQAYSTIGTLSIQKKSIEDDIASLTVEKDRIASEIAEAREGKDRTLNNLSSAITTRTDELQALDVKQETMRVEHQRKVDELKHAEETLTASVQQLRNQEIELTNKNGTLQHEVAQRETEVQDIMANLKKRENELDARERAVKNKERGVATQLRRNLT
jgi:chromosome segregation ATPase